MFKKIFQIAIVAGAVAVTTQSINVETAHAGSVVDLGSFAKQHSGKLGSLLDKYGLESVREKYLKSDDDNGNYGTNKSNSSNGSDKYDLDSVLNHPTLRKFK